MGYAHGRKWKDGDVENAIMNIVNTLKLDHFPTKSEMIDFYGDMALSNKVSKKRRKQILCFIAKFGNSIK